MFFQGAYVNMNQMAWRAGLTFLDCRQNSDMHLKVNIRLLILFAAGGDDNILLSNLFVGVCIAFLYTVGLYCP